MIIILILPAFSPLHRLTGVIGMDMIICMCSRGDVRSVTLAALLKDYGGIEGVITAGVDTIGEEAFTNLIERQICINSGPIIYLVGEANLFHRLQNMIYESDNYIFALYWIDIGPDIWLSPMHPELMKAIADKLRGMDLLPDPGGPYSDIDAYLAANEAAFYRHRRG